MALSRLWWVGDLVDSLWWKTVMVKGFQPYTLIVGNTIYYAIGWMHLERVNESLSWQGRVGEFTQWVNRKVWLVLFVSFMHNSEWRVTSLGRFGSVLTFELESNVVCTSNLCTIMNLEKYLLKMIETKEKCPFEVFEREFAVYSSSKKRWCYM